MLYRSLLRPLLFRMDPEKAHHLGLAALRAASVAPWMLRPFFSRPPESLRRELFGLSFPGPVGLAAGFDKNALAVPALARLGFGFLEVGAVSAEARPGNPGPRIFRLPDDGGLINRMGLPNDGAAVISERLAALRRRAQPDLPLFANIAKTSDLEGDTDTMAADYVKSLDLVLPHVDGVSVNISCPARPELAAFGQRDAMRSLLERVKDSVERSLPARGERPRPAVLLKVSPDIDEGEKEAIDDAAGLGLLDGLVLTNTTRSRPVSLKAPAAITDEAGGLSGRPLFSKALSLVAEFSKRAAGELPIVGVGGISEPEDAERMLEAGADLVEIYTGFVYGGPGLPGRIHRHLARR